MTSPLVVSWGGGTNSTALLVGMHQKAIRPDLILFADTGGEKPDTYIYLHIMNLWIKENTDFPRIIRVQDHGKYTSLENECLTTGKLPALAYGYKTCSQKYKIRPQDNYLKKWAPAIECWGQGEKVTKVIGIDAGEIRRATYTEDDKFKVIYPLIDWNWAREECIEAIKGAGLKLPGKSACFYCPASKKPEILELQKTHPDLLARALKIEDNAAPNLTKRKGLGGRFSWRRFVEAENSQQKLFPDALDEPCICFDGADDEADLLP